MGLNGDLMDFNGIQWWFNGLMAFPSLPSEYKGWPSPCPLALQAMSPVKMHNKNRTILGGSSHLVSGLQAWL